MKFLKQCIGWCIDRSVDRFCQVIEGIERWFNANPMSQEQGLSFSKECKILLLVLYPRPPFDHVNGRGLGGSKDSYKHEHDIKDPHNPTRILIPTGQAIFRRIMEDKPIWDELSFFESPRGEGKNAEDAHKVSLPRIAVKSSLKILRLVAGIGAILLRQFAYGTRRCIKNKLARFLIIAAPFVIHWGIDSPGGALLGYRYFASGHF